MDNLSDSLTGLEVGASLHQETQSTQVILSKLTRKLTLLFAILLVSCVTAPPAQEMSDARQAIRSAEEAGANDHAQIPLFKARDLLEQALISLEAGEYRDAKRFALDARYKAIRAREQARSKVRLIP